MPVEDCRTCVHAKKLRWRVVTADVEDAFCPALNAMARRRNKVPVIAFGGVDAVKVFGSCPRWKGE